MKTPFFPLSLSVIFIFCSSLIGCTNGDADYDGEDLEQRASFVETGSSAVVDEGGFASFEFQVIPGISAFQILIDAPAAAEGQNPNDVIEASIISLRDSSGRVLYSADSFADVQSTPASEPQALPFAFNFPLASSITLANFPAVAAGTYRATAQLSRRNSNASLAGLALSIRVLEKRDDDIDSGVVTLHVIYAGAVADSDETIASIRKAMVDARTAVEAGGMSVSMQFHFRRELPSVFPDPSLGSAIFEEISNDVGLGIPIIFASDTDGLNSRENEYAVAGGSPGPGLPGPRSAITVSIRRSAGGDGQFDIEEGQNADRNAYSEIQLMGEAVAHEIYSYLGLTDTVTFRGSEVVAVDQLDSPKCPTLTACERDNKTAENVMFPYAVIENDVQTRGQEYFHRQNISTDQGRAANRHVLVE